MGTVRRWVFPIVWMIILGAASIALVKIAFFPDSSADADPTVPTGELTEPTVAVGRGTITNDLTLQGTVAADPAVPMKATAAGTVDDVYIAQGAVVATGDLVYDIRVETPRDPVETTNPDSTVTVTQPEPSVRFERVYAPTSGTLSALGVIHDQAVTVGEVTGQVAPPTFAVTGSIDAQQLYRIQDRPTEAQVAITGGPAGFTCTGLTITTPLAGEGEAPAGDGATGATGSGTSFRCQVPPEVTVFPGLAASVTLAGGKAENVLVVPTTAVEGSAQSGVVYRQADDGTTEEVPVTLGLTDGVNVEITGGIDEGALLLQFVPGAAAGEEVPLEGDCIANPDGSVICS
ncbi:efflux RND transporter periplasmic adaptor subunit [Rathayibacter sp. VKM Ac-2803]|uniref:efflux RND transporter periplasmic adaptor subunit n=1 Tax=Rathayibacter sp. VKM Ac-2803 TaxID=2609256 RepID=UPI00135A7189|nr:efflux RND transporter periplasmic adaptor subunit [Rathayibacter sp. VKM Ac-2803]